MQSSFLEPRCRHGPPPKPTSHRYCTTEVESSNDSWGWAFFSTANPFNVDKVCSCLGVVRSKSGRIDSLSQKTLGGIDKVDPACALPRDPKAMIVLGKADCKGESDGLASVWRLRNSPEGSVSQ